MADFEDRHKQGAERVWLSSADRKVYVPSWILIQGLRTSRRKIQMN